MFKNRVWNQNLWPELASVCFFGLLITTEKKTLPIISQYFWYIVHFLTSFTLSKIFTLYMCSIRCTYTLQSRCISSLTTPPSLFLALVLAANFLSQNNVSLFTRKVCLAAERGWILKIDFLPVACAQSFFFLLNISKMTVK